MRFIGVDLGTTFVKGGLLDVERGTLTHVERLPFPDPIMGLPQRHFEVDALRVAATTRALIERLALHAPDCAGIVMSSQMHGVVLMDERGAPLHNAITWRDERGLAPHPAGGTYYDAMLTRLPAGAMAELGGELKPGRPAVALFRMREQGRLPARATVAALPDFVISQLTGAPPQTEATHASAHGLFNVWTGDWHADVINALGLAGLTFPLVVPAGAPVGAMALASHKVPIYAAIGDQQAALLGAGLREGELSLNISTGSQCGVLFRPRARAVDPAIGDVQVRPYFDGMLLKTITHIPAGRALNVLVALLSQLAERAGTPLADPWALISDEVDRVVDEGANGLAVDLSFFGGAGDDASAGAIRNIREDNLSAGALFHAAFDDMARRYAEAAARLRAPEPLHIAFSGGLAMKSAPLRERITRNLRAEQRLCDVPEDALSGLLALARWCNPA